LIFYGNYEAQLAHSGCLKRLLGCGFAFRNRQWPGPVPAGGQTQDCIYDGDDANVDPSRLTKSGRFHILIARVRTPAPARGRRRSRKEGD
jgi:hypothetical protein